MARLRHISKELHDAWLLKEQLLSIYRVADNAACAKSLLTEWPVFGNGRKASRWRPRDEPSSDT